MVEEVIVIYYVASFKYHLLGASIIPMVSPSEASAVRSSSSPSPLLRRWKEAVERARERKRWGTPPPLIISVGRYVPTKELR
jgi:hypothetical protein